MFCPKCGAENSNANNNCTKCGNLLNGAEPQAQRVQGSDVGISTIIPYKNAPALIGYYLGVFSIIPFFPIGITALILGIKGLKKAKEHPEAKGKAHAWVGIIAGGFFGLLWTALTVIMIIIAMSAK